MTQPQDAQTSFSCSSPTKGSNSAFIAAKRAVMPQPAPVMHLSPAFEVAIRLLPGNDRCVDCKAVCPQWAGVSFGVLLCLVCAGKHRSLGVHTSFVKSLVMDSWSMNEVRLLKAGGNAKWLAVCAGIRSGNICMEEKYSSSVARAYSSQVSLAALKATDSVFTATSFLSTLKDTVLLREDMSAFKEVNEPLSTPMMKTHASSDIDSVKCTTCSSMVSLSQLDSHSQICTISSWNAMTWRKYERHIGIPGECLGLSLVKATDGYAEVSRIIPGGAAQRANIIIGSFLIGLNNTKNLKFDEIVNMLRRLPKPMLFHFMFRSQSALEPIVPSIPKPRTEEIKVTLHDKEELGCSLSTNAFYCIVSSVDDDSIARRHNILVGARVIALNGRKFLKPKETIREICTAKRPIEITLHRMEGLMREWSD